MSLQQKIADIENELSHTQVNKATMRHICLQHAKLAQFKKQLMDDSLKNRPRDGFDVVRNGDARVGLVGFPSVGKSTMLTHLTDTESKIAEYEFTTLTCIPGIIDYNGSHIQLLDLPGIIEGAKDGVGRGRQVIACAKTCDCILLVLDGTKSLEFKEKVEYELEGFGIRLNKTRPDIKFTKRERGGIQFRATCEQSQLTQEIVEEVLNKEYGIQHGEVECNCDATVEELIDIVGGDVRYIPCIYVINKIDDMDQSIVDELSERDGFVCISAQEEINLDVLLEMLWDKLKLIRIYPKPMKGDVDYDSPIILPQSKANVETFCYKVHKDLVRQMKYANVWGTSVKHSPQRVGREHMLEDEDVVQIIK